MHIHHQPLPLGTGTPFITDAGLETELIFKKNYELPEFASFPLLDNAQGRQDLREYYAHYLAIARSNNTGIILEAPTWRASADWGAKLGYNSKALARINRDAIAFLADIRNQATLARPCVISGCIGPRYDGYNPEQYMNRFTAAQYHHAQIKVLSNTEADLVTALTITSSEEACGIAEAARQCGIPVVISFTTETDGLLPSDETLQQAIEQVEQHTDAYPLYYMINCAHPTHFETALVQNQPWVNRIGGIRANASCKSHAELDESTEIDAGNPEELGQQYRQLKTRLHNLNVVGGCCGTNHQHVAAMTQACFG